MSENVDIFRHGNIVTLKKPHPCGSFTFEVVRTGADIKLCCTSCRHTVMLPRQKALKALNLKKTIKSGETNT